MANREQDPASDRPGIQPKDLNRKIADSAPAFTRVSRRKFLLRSGGVAAWAMSLGLSGLYYTAVNVLGENDEKRKLNSEPKLPPEEVNVAKQEVSIFKDKAKAWQEGKNLDEIPQVDKPEDLNHSFEVVAQNDKRQKLEDGIWNTWDKVAFGIGATALFVSGVGLKNGFSVRRDLISVRESKEKLKRRFVRLVLNIRPEWAEKPPSTDELGSFCRGLSYLPPVGGKLIKPNDNEKHYFGGNFDVDILEPSFMAERQVDNVIQWRRRNSRRGEYIHQLTVQGQLPDEFKYVALALILSSPYENDWNEPFFEASWGMVAPLVHDGGNVNTGYSPVWAGKKGRTDFLQRISFVHEPKLEELESLPIAEVSKLSSQRLTGAIREREERERLFLEARAYQRLALALHAKNGTAPKAIPRNIRRELKREWIGFQSQLHRLLKEYGVDGSANVSWFREKPVNQSLFGFKDRYEAEWLPIQKELLVLEETIKEHPEMMKDSRVILKDFSDRIDQAIGILPRGD